MSEGEITRDEIYRFILTHIDTVPQIEALLLLWESRPKQWSPAEVAARVYSSPDAVARTLNDLASRQLIARGDVSDSVYFYESSSESQDRMIQAVADTYRKELIEVSTLIHSKQSSAARAFANAFKFTKEQR